MCGIVGVFTNKPRPELTEFVKRMIAYDSIRGVDSTGVFTTDVGGAEPDLEKNTSPGYEFINGERATQLLSQPKTGLILAHNRASTRGGVKVENAHPFWIGDASGEIALVHNGTLISWRGLTGAGEFDVDSHAVANSICLDGLEATVKEITGSYALVWYDLRKKTLNFYRETNRPMNLLKLDDNTLVFSSQVDIARAAADACRLPIETIGAVESWHHHVFQWDSPVKFTKTWVEAKEMNYTKGYTRGDLPQGNTYRRGNSYRTVTEYPTYSRKESSPLVVPSPAVPPVNLSKGAVWDKYKNQEVEFLVCSVSPSRSRKSNELVSVMTADPFLTVVAFDVTRKIQSGDTCKGRVTSLTAEAGIELVVANLQLVEAGGGPQEKTYAGPGGQQLTKERMEKYIANGCESCQKPLSVEEPITWWNLMPICEGCLDEWMTGDVCKC